MIVDCHGHYTTAPKSLEAFRKRQIDGIKDPSLSPAKDSLRISDDELRDSLEGAQLKFQRARGTDLTIFSPRAAAWVITSATPRPAHCGRASATS